MDFEYNTGRIDEYPKHHRRNISKFNSIGSKKSFWSALDLRVKNGMALDWWLPVVVGKLTRRCSTKGKIMLLAIQRRIEKLLCSEGKIFKFIPIVAKGQFF